MSNLTKNNNELVEHLKGSWEYECLVTSIERFPDKGGEFGHGGKLLVSLERTNLATKIKIKGERNWMMGSARTRVPLKELKTWKSIKGAYIKDDEFLYQYNVNSDNGTVVNGISFFKFKQSDIAKGEISGHFYYLPHPDVHNSDDSREIKNLIIADRIINNKWTLQWLQIYGTVKLKKIKLKSNKK